MRNSLGTGYPHVPPWSFLEPWEVIFGGLGSHYIGPGSLLAAGPHDQAENEIQSRLFKEADLGLSL